MNDEGDNRRVGHLEDDLLSSNHLILDSLDFGSDDLATSSSSWLFNPALSSSEIYTGNHSSSTLDNSLATHKSCLEETTVPDPNLLPTATLSNQASPVEAASVTFNVKINRETWLKELHEYTAVNHVVEYPKTSKNGNIGHL